MTNTPDPLFPPFGKAQAPNPYSQGVPTNTPPSNQYGQNPVGPSPYGPPPPEAYQNPVGAPSQNMPAYPPQNQYPTPGGYPVQNYYNSYTSTLSVNKLAIWSMITGIAGIILAIFTIGILSSIAAVILGHMAVSQIKKNPTVYSGTGYAVTGLVTGYIIIILSALLYGFILLVSAAFNGYSGY